jgi:WD40 repeat protein
LHAPFLFTLHVFYWGVGVPPLCQGHSKESTAVAFNRDATVLASASIDRTVKLWGK